MTRKRIPERLTPPDWSGRLEDLDDLDPRQVQILTAFLQVRIPATDRQIAGLIRVADVGYVRPAITRLVQAGYLVECPRTRDRLSDRIVRTTLLAPELEHRPPNPAQYRLALQEDVRCPR